MTGEGSAKRTIRCPGCGVFIVMEDATCTLRHPSPICGVFAAVVRAAGLQARRDPWVELVRPDGTVVEKGKA